MLRGRSISCHPSRARHLSVAFRHVHQDTAHSRLSHNDFLSVRVFLCVPFRLAIRLPCTAFAFVSPLPVTNVDSNLPAQPPLTVCRPCRPHQPVGAPTPAEPEQSSGPAPAAPSLAPPVGADVLALIGIVLPPCRRHRSAHGLRRGATTMVRLVTKAMRRRKCPHLSASPYRRISLNVSFTVAFCGQQRTANALHTWSPLVGCFICQLSRPLLG